MFAVYDSFRIHHNCTCHLDLQDKFLQLFCHCHFKLMHKLSINLLIKHHFQVAMHFSIDFTASISFTAFLTYLRRSILLWVSNDLNFILLGLVPTFALSSHCFVIFR